MRHTRNRQMLKLRKSIIWSWMKNQPIEEMIKLEKKHSLDPTFKWHSEAVGRNFWSNVHKSCVTIERPSDHPYSYDGKKTIAIYKGWN